MSRTMINVGAVIEATGQINAAKSSVGSVKSSFVQTKNSIDGKIKNRANIGTRLGAAQNQLTDIDARLGKIRSMVQSGANLYRSTDEKVESWREGIRNDVGVRSGSLISSVWASWFNSDSVGGVQSKAEPTVKEQAKKSFWKGELEHKGEGAVWSTSSEDGESFFDVLSGSYSVSAKPDYGKYKDKKIFGDKDHLNVNVDQTKIRDEDKQVNPDEKWYKEKAALFETTAQAKVEGSVLDGKIAGSNDWAEGSVEGKLLTGEAHAEVSAGLYVYTKNKDGSTQKVFSPGISAEVGASVAVVQVEAEGRIGLGEDKNMLGVYGDVEAEVLTAEAKAKVAFNRKEVYAGASAEADIAKISGTAGVSVLGTDVGVTGSLKVGVGAHAEVGYTDGKLKVDIGAAVGVGFDLGFEVDVSGTVDAAVDVATSAWDGVTDAWDNATSTISDAWNWLF